MRGDIVTQAHSSQLPDSNVLAEQSQYDHTQQIQRAMVAKTSEASRFTGTMFDVCQESVWMI